MLTCTCLTSLMMSSANCRWPRVDMMLVFCSYTDLILFSLDSSNDVIRMSKTLLSYNTGIEFYTDSLNIWYTSLKFDARRGKPQPGF